MPTEEHYSVRLHQGVPQSVLALMPPLKILATSVGAALLVCGLLFAYASSPAWAAEITVNRLADDADPNDGECTLREAITAANTDTASGTATGECAPGSGDDEIHFALPGTAPWTVNLTTELPPLTSNITLMGPGADQLTVTRPDTAENFRIFTVTGNTTVVTISGMTISGGNALDVDDRGGGIRNFGTLTITDSTINGNTAGDGGAIRNDGTLTVSNSTLSDNTSNGDAGAIHNVGVLTVSNSTFSDNSADGGAGGAIFNQCILDDDSICIVRTGEPTGTVTVTNSTFSGNSAAAGGGIFNNSGAPTLKNTIVANSPSGGDCFARPTDPITDAGYNLVEDGSCLTAATSLSGDPMLGDLADNGGPTMTHALLTGSPAIDAIPQGTNGCGTDVTEDQRGVSRPQGSACDIGSFELEKTDTEAPKVISTFPRGGGEVGPAANIRATFSEDMQEASVINAFKLFRKGSTNQIAAAVTYDAATDIATLNPTTNLRRGATYKAVVSTQAKDEAGNRLDQVDFIPGFQQKVWFFEIDN